MAQIILTPEALEKARENCAPLRCEVTDHPLGTDTWNVGYWCQCGPCRVWLDVALALTEQAQKGEAARIEAVAHFHGMQARALDAEKKITEQARDRIPKLCPICTVTEMVCPACQRYVTESAAHPECHPAALCDGPVLAHCRLLSPIAVSAPST